MDGLKKKKYIHTSRKRFDPFAFLLGTAILIYLMSILGSSGELNSFWDLKSLLIVLGGTIASLMIQYDFYTCFSCLVDIAKTFKISPEKQLYEALAQLDHAILQQISLVDLREANEINGEVLNDSIYMIKQYLSLEEIEEFITARVSDLYTKRCTSVELLQRASLLAPALGLFGTVIGLVTLLKSLSDPALIGPAMSLALLTTAYGSGLSSLLIGPMAGRLEQSNQNYLELHRQLLSKLSILLRRFEQQVHPSESGKVA